MTKYEWESELKRKIASLPSDEIARVIEYYNELFEDNIERGRSEQSIVNEFGNPADVARKILSEYDGDLSEKPVEACANEDREQTDAASRRNIEIVSTNVPPTSPTSGRAEKAKERRKKKKGAVGTVFMWIGLALLGLLALGFAVNGAYTVVISFGVMARSFGSGMAHLGLGLVVLAGGLGMAVPIVKRYKASATDATEVEHEDID